MTKNNELTTNEPIRILHVIGVMHHGGAETMIMNFYRHIDRSKVQFDFVENDDRFADFDEEIHSLGGRIYKCPHYNGKNHFQYVAWWKKFLAIHAGEYKVVHGHVGSTAAIYLSLAKKAGLFTIAHSHNVSGFGMNEMVYQVFAYPTRFIADYFFGCSKAAGESRYGPRVCRSVDKFRVLNNAIETERFAFNPQLRNRIRSQLGISDKIVIGHIGRFEEQKNHTFLVRVFKEIHDRNPNSILLLLGKGKLENQIADQVAKSKLEDFVIFAGVHDDVSPYYQAMDVFVLPSHVEGLGIVAVEAQTSGLPCVISDGVSNECIRSEGLVSVRSLNESAGRWAEHILSRLSIPRVDHSEEVKINGYDVSETAVWLENYYLKIGGD